MQIVLVAPQIAPNTGNVVRLAANVGASLHLVEPLGFSMDARLLRRGGLDYHELTDVHVHADVDSARAACPGRWLALTARARRRYDAVDYRDDDVLVFGCEATGLPDYLLATFSADERLRIPMRPDNRSLNLGNAVAVVAYEAWRQLGFTGAADDGTGTLEALSADAQRREA
ncbi:tRNA (cytidine(34)-2'-O)-methyltransferase [Dermacoccus nishinomiyaensis]|uniref:tRNA (cytidine(34)-2'-O)-methyltransferase n=1 Tax=Dermacoccus nishinomiyaensis TaxID=1274 RepID=UPI0030CD25FA